MSRRKISSIVLIGAGNVAWHLGQALADAERTVQYVHSRGVASASALGQRLNCRFGNDLTHVPTDADLYLLAVSDGQIEVLVQALAAHLPMDALVVHTSGATSSLAIGRHFKHYGVFYPLQTFSKERSLPFRTVPLCLLANGPADLTALKSLATALSDTVEVVNDDQRLKLHLAAVFVNNFTNHLQHISQAIVEEQQLPGQLLLPLLQETIAKLEELLPEAAQTGPAVRGDQQTIERHLALLQGHPTWQAVYGVLSQSIQRSSGM